jgi:site-specific DNA recombinase
VGSAQRGVGILRNELYRGVRVWGRLGTVKDRESGRRKAVPGIGSVQRVAAPELQIIDDGLWARVQQRLSATSVAVAGPGQHRPAHLLSGLIRCGSCGGAMTSAGTGGYLRCSGRTNRGGSSCTNTRNPSYPRIERVVLEGIEANLLHPLAIEEAMKAFRRTLAEGRRAQASQRGPLEREIADAKRRAERLVREVEDGMPWSAVKDRHAQLVAQQTALEARLRAEPTSEVVTLHTGTAQAYRGYVAELKGRLAKPVAVDARDAVRSLISEVRFLPGERKGVFDLDITADLAPVIAGNRSGPQLVEAAQTRSCFKRSHEFEVTFRLAG